ncbi:MAG TPA: phosphatidylglycerol lysyltransferase domain-containing protein [Patescibacteria group bacterium]|nr:phosphatidylglycerol lysyltransferase domain-containing protein [Patescibacteria group bacterium]
MADTQQKRHLVRKLFVLRLVAFGVFANGLLIIASVLASHITIFRHTATSDARISVSIIIGMSFIYLSTLLVRRKQIAWAITIGLYAFLLGLNTAPYLSSMSFDDFGATHFLRSIVLPLVVLCSLAYYRHEFTVRSDIRNFALSLRFICLVLIIAFLYGVIGFQLLDKHDFRQEISLVQAAHYTVDQFGLTTNKALIAFTARGHLFLNSLSLVSATALAYVAISLFQPIKARLSDQNRNRLILKELLERYGGSSEDFFKLWPHDKGYYLAAGNQAGLAFRVERGVALVVGDPVGQKVATAQLLTKFHELCRTNDWTPAFIHTEPKWSSFYKTNGYSLQKIGQEAILELGEFTQSTSRNKYFRQISNRFGREGYEAKMLLPPHSPELINRLRNISNEWLKLPGRAERGLMMGHFTAEYMQMSHILAAIDKDGIVQGFINQIPSFDVKEANYDLLRQSSVAISNTNDFLLIEFAKYLHANGFDSLNLGLCPLTGLKYQADEDKTIIDSALQFVYANGDRFYSFSGLYRFKAKYEPRWQNRYIAYKGGIRTFSRVVNALNKAMRVHHGLKISS